VADEFDRQLEALLGIEGAGGLTGERIRGLVEPLRELVPAEAADPDGFPFLVVLRDSVLPTVEAVGRWSVGGKPGWTDMAEELAGFRPIPEVDVPDAPAYLLLDVRTGRDTLGVRPSDAQPKILAEGRTPLTIDEGVALLLHHPDVFTTHHAFQALGSRAQNARVPSFWMSKGAPRLGWCWWNNPHSWLGAASAGKRVYPARERQGSAAGR
jgi:hypothetical protein